MSWVSMATRDELLAAVAGRYHSSTRAERIRILDEFAALTGYHRKHVMRLSRRPVRSALSVAPAEAGL